MSITNVIIYLYFVHSFVFALHATLALLLMELKGIEQLYGRSTNVILRLLLLLLLAQ